MKTHHATPQAIAYATKKGCKVRTGCGRDVEPSRATSQGSDCDHPGCAMPAAFAAMRRVVRPSEAKPKGGAVYLDIWTPAQPWIDWALRGE